MQITNNIQVLPKDILWVKGEINYSRIFFANGSTILVCFTLKELEQRLNTNYSFIRVHRTYLVNISHLSKVDLKRREVKVMNKILPIARRRLVELSKISFKSGQISIAS